MREHRCSRAAYRLLLRAYPRDFRRRHDQRAERAGATAAQRLPRRDTDPLVLSQSGGAAALAARRPRRVRASDLPLEPDGDRRAATVEHPTGPGLRQAVAVTWVHGEFLESYGIPLIAGRTFSADEQRDNRQVAVVNKRLADAFWTGENPWASVSSGA